MKKVKSVSLSEELIKRVLVLCEEEQRSFSLMLEILVKEALRKEEQ
jgi:hypothetical protein